jgi:6-phosphogluconolactonase/glucosamine-6-phosphate isomerase/deaminase
MYKEGVPAEDYALEYEKLLKLLRRGWKIWPCFIRMGDDGHTASLFQVKPYCKNAINGYLPIILSLKVCFE